MSNKKFYPVARMRCGDFDIPKHKMVEDLLVTTFLELRPYDITLENTRYIVSENPVYDMMQDEIRLALELDEVTFANIRITDYPKTYAPNFIFEEHNGYTKRVYHGLIEVTQYIL